MLNDPEVLAKSGMLDEPVLCPDCGGNGRYHGDRCALCQGKGGVNLRTGEAVPADDIPLQLGGSNQGRV